MYKLLATLITLFLFSCKQQQPVNEIIIEGSVKNIPNGKVYLTEAHRWKIPLDSAVCSNGHFKFVIKPDSAFAPYMASIYFSDSSKSSGLTSLIFRNHMLKADSLKFAVNAFYLEKGHTNIEGDNNAATNLRVFAGRETDLLYNPALSDFGWLGNLDANRRAEKISFIKLQIKKYPYSYYLLEGIKGAKEQYLTKEMEDILKLFNADVQQSNIVKQISVYLTSRHDSNKPYPNLSLVNPANERHTILDSNAKLNMLVFWASWCGPCRKEIPALKKLYLQYHKKGLNLVNISIDDNKANWLQAVNQEKMDWPQYIVDKENIEKVRKQFNFSAIPFILFADKTGNEVKKIVGYDEQVDYNAVIENYVY